LQPVEYTWRSTFLVVLLLSLQLLLHLQGQISHLLLQVLRSGVLQALVGIGEPQPAMLLLLL
jgi:hypothetical protein